MRTRPRPAWPGRCVVVSIRREGARLRPSNTFAWRGGNELTARRAEVQALRVTKAELELRLQSSTSLEATKREARRIGYVLPGERLFVVKGIPAWRMAQRNLKGDG